MVRSNVSRWSGALPAMLLALAGCSATNDGAGAGDRAIQSHVALFQVDASQVQSGGGSDELAKLLVARCTDAQFSTRFLESLKSHCGPEAAALLESPLKSVEDELGLAWQATPRPEFAVAVTVRPKGPLAMSRSGSWVLSTLGWLVCGIPGYVVDDYEYGLPVEIEARLWWHNPTGDRHPLKTFTTATETYVTDYIDRNDFISVPYCLTILVPPHVLSAWDQDNLDATADALFQSALDRITQGVAARIREHESSGKASKAGG
jgi:hypothetical protein